MPIFQAYKTTTTNFLFKQHIWELVINVVVNLYNNSPFNTRHLILTLVGPVQQKHQTTAWIQHQRQIEWAMWHNATPAREFTQESERGRVD